MEGLDPEPAVVWGFSAQWPTPPCLEWDGPQVAGAEALRFRLKQSLLPLSVFPPPRTGAFALKERSAAVGEAHVITEVSCAACVGVCGSAQTQPKLVSFPLLCFPRSSAMLWHGVGGARVFARLGLGFGALWLQELKQLHCCQRSMLLS